MIGDNLKWVRDLCGLSQDALAERMKALGHRNWFPTTISEAERGLRLISSEELLALALALETTIYHLLSPLALHKSAPRIDIGLGRAIPAHMVDRLILPVDTDFQAYAPLVRWAGNVPELHFPPETLNDLGLSLARKNYPAEVIADVLLRAASEEEQASSGGKPDNERILRRWQEAMARTTEDIRAGLARDDEFRRAEALLKEVSESPARGDEQ